MITAEHPILGNLRRCECASEKPGHGPAPVLRPRQLDRLDALAVKADHLVVEEELDLPIPLAEADPATGVDPVLRVGAQFGLKWACVSADGRHRDWDRCGLHYP